MKEFGFQKSIIDKVAAMRTLKFFSRLFLYVCIDSALMGRSTCTRAFGETIQYLDTLNICIKEFYSKMIIIDKMTAIGT